MAEKEARVVPDYRTSRDMLPLMEVRLPGRRRADGTVVQDLVLPVRLFMYGPFVRLAAGAYRLSFEGAFPGSWQKGQPILGVEVIAQNRMLRAWRDFTLEELRDGDRSIVFTVPPELSLESGIDAPFEFRFTGFGTARFTITALTLVEASKADVDRAQPTRWRLLGRMRPLPRAGAVSLSRLFRGRARTWRSWSPFYLPAGLHRIEVRGTAGDTDRPALELSLKTRDGGLLGSDIFTGAQLLGGDAHFLFDVPADSALNAGMPQHIDLSLTTQGKHSVTIDSIDVVNVADDPAEASSTRVRAPAQNQSRRQKLLIFGNCQGNMVARAMRENSGFARRFTIKHHFMELPENLHDQGRRDIDEADVMLVQDIGEWDQYPLRNHVPDDLLQIRYPCVRFASLWPFDAFNGPDDRYARDKDFPNFEFTYFDGLLARLRREIPDPEQRFIAYRDLSAPRIIDPRRLHQFEEKRLLAMDKKYPAGMGAYILDNFRRRRTFYTTAHPNGTVLTMLMKYLAGELGVRQLWWRTGLLDSLRNLQVPVHPKVAEALGVRWAGRDARYLVRGEKVSWEQYFRKYIDYYG